MPRVKALGSPAMKAMDARKRATGDEVARAKAVRTSLKKLQMDAGMIGMGSNERFAELLGLSPKQYERILQDPLRLNINRIRAIQSVARFLNAEVDLGLEEFKTVRGEAG